MNVKPFHFAYFTNRKVVVLLPIPEVDLAVVEMRSERLTTPAPEKMNWGEEMAAMVPPDRLFSGFRFTWFCIPS